jgi:N-hydroxyarylamine O-acetyltransferase
LIFCLCNRILDPNDYLKRLNYSGSLTPTAETLRALHLAHLLNVPFENLDIHLGKRIQLNETELYTKIVSRRRGGFCFELNGLFAWLLRELGFEVTLLSARVGNGEGGFGPEFDHLTLRVFCPADPVGPDVPWLADVGFGECFLNPLRLDWFNHVQDQAGPHAYRIDKEAAYLGLWEKRDGAEWQEQYRFTLKPRRLEEFQALYDYHQTSPASHFTQKRICSRATENGRLTLSEDKLIVSESGQRLERPVLEQAYRAVLEQEFGIKLDQDFIKRA